MRDLTYVLRQNINNCYTCRLRVH